MLIASTPTGPQMIYWNNTASVYDINGNPLQLGNYNFVDRVVGGNNQINDETGNSNNIAQLMLERLP